MRNNSYGSLSGTSMAAPLVTGTVALLLAAHPGWSYSQIIQQVLKTARPDSAVSGKTVTGGVLNAAAALGGVADNQAAIADAGSSRWGSGRASSGTIRPARPGPSPAPPACLATAAASPRQQPGAAGRQVAFLQDTGSMTQAVPGWAAGSYVLSFKAAQRGNSRPRSRTSASWSTGAWWGRSRPRGRPTRATRPPRSRWRPGRTRSRSRGWTPPAATTPPSSTPSRRSVEAPDRRRGVRAGGGGGRQVPVPPHRLALDLHRRRRRLGQRQRLHLGQPAGAAGRAGGLPPGHRLDEPGGGRLGGGDLRAELQGGPAGQPRGVAAGLPRAGRRRGGGDVHALGDDVPGPTPPPRSRWRPGRTRSPSRGWTPPAATTPPSIDEHPSPTE